MHLIQYMYPAEYTKPPSPSYVNQLFFSFPDIVKAEGLSTSPHLSTGPNLSAFNPLHIPKVLKYLFNTITNLCFIFGNVFQNDVRIHYLDICCAIRSLVSAFASYFVVTVS